ncbi:MAG: type II secretion system protein [Deltaproteobacteria bacterium]|nr:type II secretion system protein [Deltaproteobacteria bacterium]MBZ0219813.1 type II secretion system protein [Deltaproteobacteria bacterium]
MNGRTGGGNGGFTYLSLLFLVTLMGLAAGTAGKYWSFEVRREKEEELIFRGMEIRRAIGKYYSESPGAKTYPRSIDDLANDPRYPVTKRHLRKIYHDPMTGEADWEVIRAPDGGIMGVRSSSQAEPIKKQGFPPELKGFENRYFYNEWQFVFVPQEPKNKRP